MIGIINGVTICDKHSYNDFGLIMTNKVISGPEPQIERINVPFRNGSIDLTEVNTHDVRYKDRTIKITFFAGNNLDLLPDIASKIQMSWSGQKTKIIFDDDLSYYWLGRIESVEPVTSERNIYINLTAVVEPYKYNIQSTMDDWLWDFFDFENGYIQQLADLTVDGTLSVDIHVTKPDNPIIISNANMTLTCNGVSVSLVPGKHKVYDILLQKGTNTLEFTGNGVISIDYVGGSL